nr:reverse transcriptase domain-containing protein [Tanacetum cinerariifolium]
MKGQALKVKVDSKLVACKLNGKFIAYKEGITRYMAKEKEHVALSRKFSIQNNPQNQNLKADVLSKLASVALNYLTKEILVEVLNAKSMDAQQTMLKTSNDETPFSLTYGSEAVIPAEIGMPTFQTIQFNEARSEKEMWLNLDLIQEEERNGSNPRGKVQ